MEEIKSYSKEEIDELKKWLMAQKLPQSLQLDKATYIPNMQATLSALFEQVETSYHIPQLQGYIVLLDRIKKKLEGGVL